MTDDSKVCFYLRAVAVSAKVLAIPSENPLRWNAFPLWKIIFEYGSEVGGVYFRSTVRETGGGVKDKQKVCERPPFRTAQKEL
ncbi:hypothetical protein CDAR_281471 [Caerostris darwini]|uniref:Uncharacterized protein n=1 Tax=Caerostris darwini TaxID=1538125 RepID=A0AAV4QYV0_9ARAC|nr:hypothetical protein CDAR_281471 [Caerostris darwini]